MADIELSDIMEAYFSCRKNKRRSPSAIAFEVNYERNCLELWESISNRTYIPYPSIALVINKPVKREIFAAPFRDRIVHHYIALRLIPLFEEEFIDETTNCRKGKGTGYGISLLRESIKKISGNYTSDCWIMKLDIKSFFMCINKTLLWEKLERFIRKRYKGNDLDTLLYLTDVTLKNDPTQECFYRSPLSAWKDIPPHKSLFGQKKGFGMAPGNLTSQIEANFYLNDFDHWMKSQPIEYGRYVDDFYMVSKNKQSLINMLPLIRNKLAEIGLTLHPNKIFLQHYSKGVKYIGSVLKINRAYISNRTVGNFFSTIHRFNQLAEKDGYIECNATRFASSINSYLGFCKQYMTYHIRRKAIRRIDQKWWKVFYVSGHFEKIVIKKKYKCPSISRHI